LHFGKYSTDKNLRFDPENDPIRRRQTTRWWRGETFDAVPLQILAQPLQLQISCFICGSQPLKDRRRLRIVVYPATAAYLATPITVIDRLKKSRSAPVS